MLLLEVLDPLLQGGDPGLLPLPQQRRFDGQRRLVGDRLHEDDLAGTEHPALPRVTAQHAERTLGGDQRQRQDRPVALLGGHHLPLLAGEVGPDVGQHHRALRPEGPARRPLGQLAGADERRPGGVDLGNVGRPQPVEPPDQQLLARLVGEEHRRVVVAGQLGDGAGDEVEEVVERDAPVDGPHELAGGVELGARHDVIGHCGCRTDHRVPPFLTLASFTWALVRRTARPR
jgi:hypothetical protein